MIRRQLRLCGSPVGSRHGEAARRRRRRRIGVNRT
jgi:hypothetical protein